MSRNSLYAPSFPVLQYDSALQKHAIMFPHTEADTWGKSIAEHKQ